MNEELKLIPVDEIQPSRYQPRMNFDDKKLEELADSIDADGLIQPIAVREIDDGPEGIKYELVAGERRWRATKLLGKNRIKAIVREYDEQQAETTALIENIQRDDLNPIEISASLVKLKEAANLSQADLAVRVKKSRPWVANMLRLVKLSEDAKRVIISANLPYAVGLQLLGLPDSVQSDLAEKAVENKWDSTTMAQNVAKAKKKAEKAAKAAENGEEAPETTSDENYEVEQYDRTRHLLISFKTREQKVALVKELKKLIKNAELEDDIDIFQGGRITQYLKTAGVVIGSRNMKKDEDVVEEDAA